MAMVLSIGAILVWIGGLITGGVLLEDSVLFAFIAWIGAFFEGSLLFAVSKIYEATVQKHNNSWNSINNDNKVIDTTPQNMSNQVQLNYQTAEEAYNAAHTAHYEQKKYNEAYNIYLTIIKDFPNSKEASAAKQQIEILRKKYD